MGEGPNLRGGKGKGRRAEASSTADELRRRVVHTYLASHSSLFNAASVMELVAVAWSYPTRISKAKFV